MHEVARYSCPSVLLHSESWGITSARPRAPRRRRRGRRLGSQAGERSDSRRELACRTRDHRPTTEHAERATQHAYSPLLRDNVLEGLDHARGVLARVELLARLDDIEGVEELRG